MIERLSLFLTLASLAALLVGGVGAANAVKAYMDGRARTAAILKCLGVPAHVIFRAYLNADRTDRRFRLHAVRCRDRRAGSPWR